MATAMQRTFVAPPQSAWQPGDRISITRSPHATRIRLPAGMTSQDLPLAELLSPCDKPLEFRTDWSSGELIVPELSGVVQAGLAVLQLECVGAAGRFRLSV